MQARPEVQNVCSPLANPAQLPKDGRSGLVQFEIKGDVDKATEVIEPVLGTVVAAQQANPGFRIEEFGDASARSGRRAWARRPR